MSLWCYGEVIKLIKKAKTAGCLLHVIGREAVLLVQLGEEWVRTDAHRAAEENDERWSLASSKQHQPLVIDGGDEVEGR